MNMWPIFLRTLVNFQNTRILFIRRQPQNLEIDKHLTRTQLQNFILKITQHGRTNSFQTFSKFKKMQNLFIFFNAKTRLNKQPGWENEKYLPKFYDQRTFDKQRGSPQTGQTYFKFKLFTNSQNLKQKKRQGEEKTWKSTIHVSNSSRKCTRLSSNRSKKKIYREEGFNNKVHK